MKLYEVPCNTQVVLKSEEGGPPASIAPEVGTEYYFKHIDGMYSLCMDSEGRYVHLPAWSEVEIAK